jgi:hypothetical protein
MSVRVSGRVIFCHSNTWRELSAHLNWRTNSSRWFNTWTDKFVTLRTDGRLKAFIRQQETDVVMKAKAEGSEYEFDNDAHQYGVDTWRNVGLPTHPASE